MAYISKPSKFRKAAFKSTVQIFGTLKNMHLLHHHHLFERDPHSITGLRKYTEAYTFEWNGTIFPSHYQMAVHHLLTLIRMVHTLQLYQRWPRTLRQKNFMSKYYKRWR